MTKSIYEFTVKGSNGQSKSMAEYKGSVLLLVNVASKCGYTPQYEGLQELSQKYKDQGLTVLGFPCNDFGQQEPGEIDEILQFCSANYGVSFEILDKVHAIGEEQHPLYAWLTKQTEPQGDVKWNFEKFLIAKDGQPIGRYPSSVKPDDPELIKAIQSAL